MGHGGEISNVQFNWDCSLIVSGSMDKTCKVSRPAAAVQDFFFSHVTHAGFSFHSCAKLQPYFGNVDKTQ